MTNGPFELDVDTLGNLRPISKVVLSLGSNLGESATILQEAVDILAETPELMLVEVSPVYQTTPVGENLDQPDFLNLIVIAESTLEPLVILPDPLGLRVQVASGRVTATVRASGDAGSDWTSPATAAASTLVVAGVPGGEGARTLVVTNPSDRRATVSVEVLGSDSSFAPAGADTFEVNAESTVAVPLEGALAGEVVGLRLTSTQPIMAGVRVRSGDDVAVVPASGPATGEARVPAIAGSEVVVSNGGVVPAPVTLTTRDAAGAEVDSTRVEVGAGRSTRLPVTGDRTATVELTGGTVQAVVLVTRLGTQEGIAVVPLDGGGATGVEVTPSRDVSLPR